MKIILLVQMLLIISLFGFSQNYEELNKKISDHYKLGEYIIAKEYAEQALIQCELEFGKDHEYYSSSLFDLGMIYEELENFDTALSLYKIAIEGTEKSLGKGHLDYGIRIAGLAGLYETLEQFQKAIPLYNESLIIIEKHLGKEHFYYGILSNNMAILYKYMGQYEKALPLYLQAVDNFAISLGKDDPNYGITLDNLATLYRIMGQYEKALSIYQEALENLEKSMGKEQVDYGIALNNLASLYEELGKYEKSLELFIESVKNAEKCLGKDHSQYGIRLNNLAGLYRSIGQYDKALTLYLQSLENTRKTLGKKNSQYGISLNNLAGLYENMGEYKKALRLYLEAIKNTEKSLGKNHTEYGVNSNNLAGLYESMNKYEKALPLYICALENSEKNFGNKHPKYGVHLNNLANLYKILEQYNEALSLYLKAIDLTKESLGEEHSSYGIYLNNLAGLYYLMSYNQIAFHTYLEANLNIKNLIACQFNYMTESEKESFLNTINYRFNTYHSFTLDNHKDLYETISFSYDNELLLKGLILGSSKLVIASVFQPEDTSIINKYKEWKDLKAYLGTQYTLPIEKRTPKIDSLEELANSTERILVRYSAEFEKAQSSFDITWKDVQKNLNKNEAAIEFISFQYHNKKEWTDSIIYAALLLRDQDTLPIFIPLFEEKQLRDHISQCKSNSNNLFVANLYSSAKRADILTKDTYYNFGDSLKNLIWKPFDSLLQDIESIYYAPSGVLHTIAFNAIPYLNGSFLSDRYKLYQLTSTRELTNREEWDTKITSEDKASLFGGIYYDYDFDTTEVNDIASNIKVQENETQKQNRSLMLDVSFNTENWKYLPGTLEEVKNISSSFKLYNISVTTYSGKDSREETFKDLGKNTSPDIIHISTHGFFFPDPKTKSDDILKKLDRNDIIYAISENPLFRSGLLFTGANFTWQGNQIPDGIDDGILTAYEVSNMNLFNTKLIVMSACETGLGDIKGSEGVFGLQRAFKMAGVDYIIMSLWQVPDKETVEFMNIFYNAWLKGSEIHDAFKFAQDKMKKKYDPYYWAAFVLLK